MMIVPIVRLSEVEALSLQDFDFAQSDRNILFFKISYFLHQLQKFYWNKHFIKEVYSSIFYNSLNFVHCVGVAVFSIDEHPSKNLIKTSFV
ncbi:MAG: hypothetical protein Q4C98_01900 [Capnocytophaga sp.]|nr:hypothetical protein [Capnocytophaga sp.]